MVRVSGLTKSTVQSATDSKSSMILKDFGADSDSVAKDMNTFNRMGETGSPFIGNAERPSNFWFNTVNQTSYWQMYALMDWYVSEVSVLSTIIQRSTTELFRYGIRFEPAFSKKCMQCGYESQSNITVCPQCDSRRLIRPEVKQQDYFTRPNGKSFLDEANNNGQSLKDVLRTYAESQYQNNEAYTICVTGDVPDNGDPTKIGRQYPLEFFCEDPKFVRYLYDETGTPGRRYAFTMNDRHTLLDLGKKEDSEEFKLRTQNGMVLYPASWMVGNNYGATGTYWLYTSEEVYHDHWFRQSLIYGVPIWFDIEDDLLTYHYIEKHNLKKYKFGVVRKIIILPGFEDSDVEDITKGVQDVLSKNDNSCPIICVPPQMQGVAEMKAQTLELGAENGSDLIQCKNDIRDRLCAHVGVPNLFAGDTEASGGMNNESQQITTFDRYLMDKYDYIDRQLDWVLSWFPKITDWKLRVSRPSKMDTEQKRMMDQIQLAQGMKGLGFKISYINGEFQFSEEPIDPMAGTNPAPLYNQFNQQNGARGADFDINETKNEVEDVMDESKTTAFQMSRSSLKKAMESNPGNYESHKLVNGDTWNYYLAKDAYSYIHNYRDDIISALSVGYDVSKVIQTCTPEQLKQIYIAILEEMDKSSWSPRTLVDKVYLIGRDGPMGAEFSRSDAERIVKTETARILAYAKENQCLMDNGSDALYMWTGPIDYRTTVMCRYAQTGQLTSPGLNGKGAYDYEWLRSELPEWTDKGYHLDELKDFLYQIWQVCHDHGIVNTDWIGDWMMHINCRHTFMMIGRDGHYFGQPETYELPSEEEPTIVPEKELEITADKYDYRVIEVTMDENCNFIIDEPDDEGNPIVILNSNGSDDDYVFEFENMNEQDIADWSKFIKLSIDEGEDPVNLAWMMQDENIANDDEINYVMGNYETLYQIAQSQGWVR